MSVVLPGTYSVQNWACFMSAARTHFLSSINCRQSFYLGLASFIANPYNPSYAFLGEWPSKHCIPSNMSFTKCTSWYSTCDMHKLLHVSTNFTFMWPYIVTHFFVIKPTRCTIFTNLFWHEILHVSDNSCVHHQEFIHCTLSNGICHTGL